MNADGRARPPTRRGRRVVQDDLVAGRRARRRPPREVSRRRRLPHDAADARRGQLEGDARLHRGNAIARDPGLPAGGQGDPRQGDPRQRDDARVRARQETCRASRRAACPGTWATLATCVVLLIVVGILTALAIGLRRMDRDRERQGRPRLGVAAAHPLGGGEQGPATPPEAERRDDPLTPPARAEGHPVRHEPAEDDDAGRGRPGQPPSRPRAPRGPAAAAPSAPGWARRPAGGVGRVGVVVQDGDQRDVAGVDVQVQAEVVARLHVVAVAAAVPAPGRSRFRTARSGTRAATLTRTARPAPRPRRRCAARGRACRRGLRSRRRARAPGGWTRGRRRAPRGRARCRWPDRRRPRRPPRRPPGRAGPPPARARSRRSRHRFRGLVEGHRPDLRAQIRRVPSGSSRRPPAIHPPCPAHPRPPCRRRARTCIEGAVMAIAIPTWGPTSKSARRARAKSSAASAGTRTSAAASVPRSPSPAAPPRR